ncbi:histone acetylation protein-domain-containing protein [Plectosphaerella cucumerina]|uniref:histone acetyltransferase n=1 Tax=Plectosphaerella cucumerina TaxID=40658 RepID=A0A8K0X689_9PEZI|nr:histone acetylation protein-domain-containing protein [Plectosphaerella cucumerina]
MSTPARGPPTTPSKSLIERLSRVLPKGYKFGIYHVSTPPTKTNALCSAPPGERDDKTYCESHFLTLTIDAKHEQTSAVEQNGGAPTPVPVMAIEVLIFTTAHSSTFFVSKADSTGYLSLLDLPKGTPSPIRAVCGAFLSHLIQHRRRKDIQSVVNLFARAQDQYLFPGSIKNKSKHVLDDRGLVKWWCRVLDPLLQDPPTGKLGAWGSTMGYLVVPGQDKYETRAFLPRASGSASRWELQDALRRVSHYTREFDWIPPRCLIPRYPDDPKSRYRDELDEEAAKSKAMRTTGMWKSIRSLDQFWDMLAYRQECSSGRLTGFIWVVFDPKGQEKRPSTPTQIPTPSASFHAPESQEAPSTPKTQRTLSVTTPLTTPRKLFPVNPTADGSPSKPGRELKSKKKKKKRLTGKIRSRQPRIKTRQKNYLLQQPVTSPYYFWPPEGRGQKIISENDYKRSVELLLHLDFANLGLAVGSMKRWIKEVGLGEAWDLEVTGQQALPAKIEAATSSSGAVNNLSGLVKRKRPEAEAEAGKEEPSKVNVLTAGLVRKKPKA